ncbi:zeta toxin family protein [Aliagarivorans taiwanensis]|uniref:zeta toxin family protein n=1 Tax=Aliagarivorans taiwanensis TaxID=561966 RepID=UPI000479448A|nr:zeta toxin family protein [Aliagarivorans taiwanensis]
MKLTTEELAIQQKALDFARQKSTKKRVSREALAPYPKEKDPVSVFMCGSPGAGKTEASKALIDGFGGGVLRIDNDELREQFEDYNGANSHLFQDAATRLLEAVHDLALKQSVSFILDTTLSNYAKAKENIERSLKRGRKVTILFVYQAPEQAWGFVQAREAVEGRRVPAEVFVAQFLSSQLTANQLKAEFGSAITLDLLVKNVDGSNRLYHANVTGVDQYLTNKYDRRSLKELVGISSSGE